MRIFLEDSFDSAHWLPSVPQDHKCHREHGHTYRIRMEVSGDIGSDSGWVLDYADLKRQWDPVKDILDHHLLNGVPGLENPTCELIAVWIADRIPTLTRIELRETERCGVVWERD